MAESFTDPLPHRGEGLQVLPEALRLLRSKDPAKWPRLHELGPDIALGLDALERLKPRDPLLRDLNRFRADAAVARLVLRIRVCAQLDLRLLMRVEAALAAHPTRHHSARVGPFALLRELDRWAHEHQRHFDDWFLERLAEVPSASERAAVLEWLNERASPPRPIHRLSRAVRLLDFVELEAALGACPLDDESRTLHAQARTLLARHRHGTSLPLERTRALR